MVESTSQNGNEKITTKIKSLVIPSIVVAIIVLSAFVIVYSFFCKSFVNSFDPGYDNQLTSDPGKTHMRVVIDHDEKNSVWLTKSGEISRPRDELNLSIDENQRLDVWVFDHREGKYHTGWSTECFALHFRHNCSFSSRGWIGHYEYNWTDPSKPELGSTRLRVITPVKSALAGVPGYTWCVSYCRHAQGDYTIKQWEVGENASFEVSFYARYDVFKGADMWSIPHFERTSDAFNITLTNNSTEAVLHAVEHHYERTGGVEVSTMIVGESKDAKATAVSNNKWKNIRRNGRD